jgi:hypothetical protein
MPAPLPIEEPRMQTALLHILEASDLNGFWQATQAVFQTTLPEDTPSVYLNYFDFTKSWKASAMFATADTNGKARHALAGQILGETLQGVLDTLNGDDEGYNADDN